MLQAFPKIQYMADFSHFIEIPLLIDFDRYNRFHKNLAFIDL